MSAIIPIRKSREASNPVYERLHCLYAGVAPVTKCSVSTTSRYLRKYAVCRARAVNDVCLADAAELEYGDVQYTRLGLVDFTKLLARL